MNGVHRNPSRYPGPRETSLSDATSSTNFQYDRSHNDAPILLVEDDVNTAAMMDTLLAAHRHTVRTFTLGEKALEAVAREAFALALVDIHLPDLTGLQVLAEIRKHASDMPVIIVSGDTSIDSAIAAFRSGATDYIRKPFEPVALVRSVERALDSHRKKMVEQRMLTQMRRAGVLHKILAERVGGDQEQDTLRHQAFHDALTGMANRSLLADRLTLALAQASRQESGVGVLFIDLDKFKSVNDLYGHATGDQVLIAASRRFGAALRAGDTLARIGGDEFVVVLPAMVNRADAIAVAEKMKLELRAPIVLNGVEIALTCSIGCAMFPSDGPNAEQLLDHADRAMYAQKRSPIDAHSSVCASDL